MDLVVKWSKRDGTMRYVVCYEDMFDCTMAMLLTTIKTTTTTTAYQHTLYLRKRKMKQAQVARKREK